MDATTTSAVSAADRGATDKRLHAGHALQLDGRAAAESRFQAKDKELVTTKRAFTMPPHYSGKVEEYETWRFQMMQFLSQEPYFVEFLEWIENDLYSDDQHHNAIKDENLEHEDAVRNVCADHSDPPTLLEKKEANEVRTKCLQLDWYSQQLYQVLALNCKGEALGMIKALAAGEYEGTRGVTAWYGLTRDHRGSSAQRILGFVGRVFQPQRCVNMSEISSLPELWENRIREYEKLVFQTEKIQTKVPDSCKVLIVRSLVPKDLEKDLLKIHSTAKYKTTKEYILEQAILKRDVHYDDKGKHDKPVPMEVDALLAKVTALKEGRGEKDEASDGPEFHHYDVCGAQTPRSGNMERSLVGHSGQNRERVDGAERKKKGERPAKEEKEKAFKDTATTVENMVIV